MARTAAETAKVLATIYDENFSDDLFEQFQIGWLELRSIAGVPKLTDQYLRTVGTELRESGHLLVACDSFILVAREEDLSHARKVPARLVESYLPGTGGNTEENETEENNLNDD